METLQINKITQESENLQGWYSIDGSKPFAVFEFNLQRQGSYTKRVAFTILDVFEKLGGLQAIIFSVTIFLSEILTFDKNNIQSAEGILKAISVIPPAMSLIKLYNHYKKQHNDALSREIEYLKRV